MTADARAIGRYRLFGVIAAGGLATVHYGRLVSDTGFSRTVAIKRLHPWLADEPGFVSMLLDEARVTARIRHPSVVSVIDVVEEPGEVLLVMDYVHGESLARLRAACKRSNHVIDADLVLGIMVPVLHGLHAAHVATSEAGVPLGIVHRDVSPENIMVGEDGCARLVDFGVARAIGRLQQTREGELKGKPAYMAPEQILGKEVDARTDVFAASVVLWEALTMRPLFRGENDVASAMRVLNGVIDAPSRIAAHVPRALDAIVLRGLERERERRWATAREMALELEQALSPASSARVGAWVRCTAAEALEKRNGELSLVENTPMNGGRRTGRKVLFAGAMLMVVAGGAAALVRAEHRGEMHVAQPLALPSPVIPQPAPLPPVVASSATVMRPAAPPVAGVSTKRRNCDPPYTLKEGIVVFKRECL
ncbi:MAG TPA: serine/threonine-protein kinase, partial [Polyangiaceae bacterium]|jgi:serine/threonine-protein kinase|nr:serine/threonine-protein kinase [Polyangiaceae bacterium]